MRHTVETLTEKSLSGFRVLCQLKRGNFACFDLPKNENMLIHELIEIHRYMKYVHEDTEVVFIPIQLFLTKAVHDISELHGASFRPDFIKDMGIFRDASIVLYSPSTIGATIEL